MYKEGVDINLPSLITSPLLRAILLERLPTSTPISELFAQRSREKRHDASFRGYHPWRMKRVPAAESLSSSSFRLEFDLKSKRTSSGKRAATLVISPPSFFFFPFLFPPAWDTREMINGGKTERRSHEERIARLSEYKPCRAR